MKVFGTNVALLLCGLVCIIEARRYYGGRPRHKEVHVERKPIIKPKPIIPEKPIIPIIPDKPIIPNKPIIPDKPIPDVPVRPPSCPQRPCTRIRIPEPCREETYFFVNGRRCRGCDRDICRDRNRNFGSVGDIFNDRVPIGSDQFTDPVTGNDAFNDPFSVGGQFDGIQSWNDLNRLGFSSNRLNDLSGFFDSGLRGQRNPRFNQRGFSNRFMSGLDPSFLEFSGQDTQGLNPFGNQDLTSEPRGRSSWLRSLRNAVPATDNSWAS